MQNVPHRWNSSRLRIRCSSRLECSSILSCESPFIIKHVVIAAVFQGRLNLLAEQRPTVQDCLATLVRGTLEYVQNIRSHEYGACILGKV
jgi:hypothetical protein